MDLDSFGFGLLSLYLDFVGFAFLVFWICLHLISMSLDLGCNPWIWICLDFAAPLTVIRLRGSFPTYTCIMMHYVHML